MPVLRSKKSGSVIVRTTRVVTTTEPRSADVFDNDSASSLRRSSSRDRLRRIGTRESEIGLARPLTRGETAEAVLQLFEKP